VRENDENTGIRRQGKIAVELDARNVEPYRPGDIDRSTHEGPPESVWRCKKRRATSFRNNYCV
jgi:hypothetical protein